MKKLKTFLVTLPGGLLLQKAYRRYHKSLFFNISVKAPKILLAKTKKTAKITKENIYKTAIKIFNNLGLKKAMCFKKYKFRYLLDQLNHPDFKLLAEFTQPKVDLGGFKVYETNGIETRLPLKKDLILPNYYAMLVKNAYVVPYTGFIFKKNKLYYDYHKIILEENAFSKYLADPRVIGDFKGPHIHFKKLAQGPSIDQGISLLDDFQHNYYHWLFEVLPKLKLVEAIGEQYREFPLLVPASLPKQFYDALTSITDRPVIKLERNKLYKVNKLIHLSTMSITDELEEGRINTRNRYYMMSPFAIEYLREKFNYLLEQGKPSRLIFLDRNMINRQVKDYEVIKSLAQSLGFEIIDCSQLSFKEQVKLFSSARVITGPAGASFANIIFCHPSAKILTFLTSTCAGTEAFNCIAKPIGIDFAHLKGTPENSDVYSNFTVDIHALSNLLIQMIKS